MNEDDALAQHILFSTVDVAKCSHLHHMQGLWVNLDETYLWLSKMMETCNLDDYNCDSVC